jgi:hypothetical protein
MALSKKFETKKVFFHNTAPPIPSPSNDDAAEGVSIVGLSVQVGRAPGHVFGGDA